MPINAKQNWIELNWISTLKALVLVIKLLVLYKGYNFKEKINLHQLYLFLKAFYLKELNSIKASLNGNSLSHNNIMNSYLVSLKKINLTITFNFNKIYLNYYLKKEKKSLQTRFNKRVPFVFIIHKVVQLHSKQIFKQIDRFRYRQYFLLRIESS